MLAIVAIVKSSPFSVYPFMATKTDASTRIADNKKAAFNYFFEERLEAGRVLEGW